MASELNMSDISTIEQIIRACQQRGSFRPEEMLPIGTLYQKILKILKVDQDRQDQSKKQTKIPSIEEEKMLAFDR
jgi:hypothetical protein